MIQLPNRIFFTGVPGSKWSGISQDIEALDGMNITDRSEERTYAHTGLVAHRGAYFGTGTPLDPHWWEVDYAWADPDAGCKLIKSHEWAENLPAIQKQVDKEGDWIMLVYRPSLISLTWWYSLGGFSIKYPSYTEYYKDHTTMLHKIEVQNASILEFAFDNKLTWHQFSLEWMEKTFGQAPIGEFRARTDILVTMYKP